MHEKLLSKTNDNSTQHGGMKKGPWLDWHVIIDMANCNKSGQNIITGMSDYQISS